MRHILFSFITLLFILPLATQAATVLPIAPGSGNLIKASGAAVYYLGADGKRYVFPNDKTYFSWYHDFSGVLTISDAELAAYAIGGNVTYHPGVRLVKITTDPRTYYVARHGTLRWVMNEETARGIYGNDWAKQIDDIPDAFFVNYNVDSPIVSLNQYVAEIVNGPAGPLLDINKDKNLTSTPPPAPAPAPTPVPPPRSSDERGSPVAAPPPPSSAYTASIVSSNTTPGAGDTVTLTATANPSGSISQIKIFLDNSLQRTCEYTPCAANIVLPVSNTKPSYEIGVDATWIDNHHVYTTSSLAVGAGGNNGILITISRPEVKPNDTREIILQANSSFIAKYLDIYLDGGNIKGCSNVQICRYAVPETSPTGTVHTIYGIATDANGFTKRSNTETFRVVDNDHPFLTLVTGNSNIYTGETVDVSVSASDDDGVSWTEVWLDGAKLKHCDSGLCVITAGPWSTPRTVNFVGKAADVTGLQNSATSTTVTVNQR